MAALCSENSGAKFKSARINLLASNCCRKWARVGRLKRVLAPLPVAFCEPSGELSTRTTILVPMLVLVVTILVLPAR